MQTNSNQAFRQKFLVISEAARYLGVSIDTVRRWDKTGLLHSTRPTGKTRYFAIDELETVKNSPPGSPTGPRMPEVPEPVAVKTNMLFVVIIFGKLILVTLTVCAILFLLFPEQIVKFLP